MISAVSNVFHFIPAPPRNMNATRWLVPRWFLF
jgi:hypothetical protein